MLYYPIIDVPSTLGVGDLQYVQRFPRKSNARRLFQKCVWVKFRYPQNGSLHDPAENDPNFAGIEF